jgi:glycosyltransferase involved in cell wall biosynthesis
VILLRALVPLRREIPDVLLVLAGEGQEECELKALAARLGVCDHVLFAGFQAEAWSWIKGAAVCVSASAVEGHPNAVLEAAAAGTPLVLSDIAMHRGAVGPDGALFRAPEDSDAMAGAIVSLIRDPERARTIAAAARKAVEPLSIDRAADLYADLYRRVAAGESFAGAGDPAMHWPQPALDGLRSFSG